MNTGMILPGRPSMGSWVLYGLGAETDNLPGFVVLMSTGKGGQMQPIAARQWSAGFLPSKFQGVKFNAVGNPFSISIRRRAWATICKRPRSMRSTH